MDGTAQGTCSCTEIQEVSHGHDKQGTRSRDELRTVQRDAAWIAESVRCAMAEIFALLLVLVIVISLADEL